jgi:hypothetical protein
MVPRLSRRAFLAASLPLLASPQAALAQAPVQVPARQVFDYSVDVGVLFNLITFALKGTVVKEIDPAAGRYRISMNGEGDSISLHTDARGMIRQGRFTPVEMRSHSTIRGRESRLDMIYDHDRGTVEYHSVMHTFFLGRRRQVDDTLKLPTDRRVDDLLSAELNFAANSLEQDPDGTYRTFIVRRARPEDEGPDDVSASGYHAELIPLRFQAVPEDASGRLRALIDITSFSSWARHNQPARVTFGSDRHLESVETKLILGTTFTVRVAAGG